MKTNESPVRTLLANAGGANVVAALFIMFVGIFACVAVTAQSAATVKVQRHYGTIIGQRTDGGVYAFRGVPYAEQPLGARRFMPPMPLRRSKSVVNDLTRGVMCPQPTEPEWAHMYPPVREDCLRLSIWTRSLDPSSRRPVVVWIHGGGWLLNSGSNVAYDGTNFAGRGDVVFVGINYRMGVFGFLDLAEQGDAFRSSGNLGLLDQVSALEWVRRNIAAFGGDPENVTIMGESAGGWSTATLLTLPAARGLFHKAIVLSGGPAQLRSRQYAARVTREFLALMGTKDVGKLQKLSMQDLIEGQRALMNSVNEPIDLFGPIVDGHVLPDYPLHLIARGEFAGVPVLHGITQDEGRLWLRFDPQLTASDPYRALTELRPHFGKAIGDEIRVREIVKQIESRYPTETRSDLALMLVGDLEFRQPHVRLGEALSRNGINNWMYVFTWRTPLKDMRAAHGVSMPFILSNTRVSPIEQFIGTDPPARLAELMTDTWVRFMRMGDPNHAGLPTWPVYEEGERATMRLDLEPRLMNDPQSEDRKLFAHIPFDGVSPALEWNPKTKASNGRGND